MKRAILFTLLGTVLLLGLASCGPREYKTHALEGFCNSAEGGEYIKVSGVLKISETILEYDNTYGLTLVEDIDQIKPYLRIGIPIGKGKNKMETLKDDFTLDDVIIRTDDGQFVTHGDEISVSGFFGGACGAGNSDIKVSLIETE